MSTHVFGFNVTYEIWLPDDVETGDTDNRGFVCQDVTLRDAIAEMSGYADHADEWPMRCPSWFTYDCYRHDYRSGETESRSLHIPDNVTTASRLRIARLLGVK